MDLQSAKKKIVEVSRNTPKTKFYLNVDEEGEVNISKEFVPNSSGFCYRNGSEIALPADTFPTGPQTNKQSTMAQTTATAPKAASKTAPAKKSTPAPAKKAAAPSSLGKKVTMSIKDMRAGIRKGFVYRNLQGVLLTETILAGKARQDHEREVFVSK